MRIGMVLENPFPPDIRMEKEIRALETGGHQVVVLCGHKNGQPIEDQIENTRIVRVRGVGCHSKAIRAAKLLCYRITGRKRSWEQAIRQFVREYDIQALHIHDLPLMPTGLTAAHNAGIPIVFDMHEVYPAMIRFSLSVQAGSQSRIKRFVKSLLFSPRWWEKVERHAVGKADRIIVVVEESKDRLLRMGVDSDKVFVVLNVEDVDGFMALPDQHKVATEYLDDFLIGYVGGVQSNRGLDNLISAWPHLLPRIPNAHLLIVGDGGFRPVLEDLVRDLDLTDHVTFTGWVPLAEVPTHIRAFDVAVIPHVINEHTNHTIPHKLFQYIALGKLVVAPDIRPIKRILQDTGACVLVEEWSPQGFADAIVHARALLRSGRHDPERQVAILRTKYGFHRLTEPLLELYRSLEA